MDHTLPELWRLRGDLDIALLRTFVLVVDLGGVTRAARHIGRSQPATSLQIKRLQDDLGTVLFRKAGRHLELTDDGERLAPLARRLVRLHDQTLAAVAEHQLSGRVRVGVTEDFAEDWLMNLLARFSAMHPQVSVNILTGWRAELMDRFRAGDLDLLLTLAERPDPDACILGTVPVCWIGSEAADWTEADPLPLVLLDGPCLFRDLALAALTAVGRTHRIVFTSRTVSTQWSAVRAGLGVSLRTPIGVRRPLTVVGPAGALPPPAMPALHLLLFRGGQAGDRPAAQLAALLSAAVQDQIRICTGAD